MGRRRCCCTAGPPQCFLCVTVLGCNGAMISGESVSVTGPQSAACTTGPSGGCCLNLTTGGAGTYTLKWSKSGYVGGSKSVTVASCPGTTNVTVYDSPVASALSVAVQGCNGLPLPGATLSIDSTYVITDSSGNAYFPMPPPGTYSWSISAPRFVTQTGSITITAGCSAALPSPITLSAAAGYTCCGGFAVIAACPTPVSTTLYFTCAVGSLTLTFCDCSISGYQGHGYFTGAPCWACGSPTGGGGCSVAWEAVFIPGSPTSSPTMGASAVFNSSKPGNYGVTTWDLTNPCSATYSGFCNSCCTGDSIALTPSSGPCPPGFMLTGTFTGGTGLAAAFNGGWSLTE